MIIAQLGLLYCGFSARAEVCTLDFLVLHCGSVRQLGCVQSQTFSKLLESRSEITRKLLGCCDVSFRVSKMLLESCSKVAQKLLENCSEITQLIS